MLCQDKGLLKYCSNITLIEQHWSARSFSATLIWIHVNSSAIQSFLVSLFARFKDIIFNPSFA